MARIAAIAVAVPSHQAGQEDVEDFACRLFGDALPNAERLAGIFHRGGVDSRRFCVPLDWFSANRGLREKNDLYIRHAEELSAQAVARCLRHAGLAPRDVDHLFFVSTTGMATPSIDARLIGSLGFRRDVKRTPIWGLGCAGGAAGLARAADHVRAYPGQRALLVAVELCGLTFIRNDLSKSNFVATSLFADGAAAVLVDGAAGPGPRIVASGSALFDDSLGAMGWDFGDEGMKVVIDREIPAVVARLMRPAVDGFLAANGLALTDVRRFILHPGGRKVLSAYAEALGLSDGDLRHSREVLRLFGNMSSPSVLFVLERALADGRPGDHALLAALGPGLSCESVLLRWDRP